MAKTPIIGCSRRDLLAAAGSAVLLAGLPRTASAAAPLKIATIGAGHIGSTLGAVWVKAGHPVMFSSRHPEELRDLVGSLGSAAHAGTVAEAVAFGDVVLLAVPYSALPQIAEDYGKALATKVLLFDACNPISNRDGEIAAKAQAKGAGLYTAELFPGAHIVRAFNAIPAAKFGDGGLSNGTRVGLPIAGDDPKTLAVASELIRETGFEPVVVGSLDFGRYLVPGTPLAGEHTPDEIRKIAATLK